MISFVWSSAWPFIAGSGGSETYTAGHVRELMRRGIDSRIIVIGHGVAQSKKDFPDIEFVRARSKEDISKLDDVLIFVTYALDVITKKQSYVILHIPPPSHSQPDSLFSLTGLSKKKLIAPSRFSARMWSNYYAKSSRRIPIISIVYPFATPIFSKIERPKSRSKKPRVLFAGRLHPEKGIYTLLAAMHLHPLKDMDYSLSVTTAGGHTSDGRVLKRLLQAHPKIKIVPAVNTAKGMAELMARHDVALMPTTNIFWRESFGIVSVEAQHAGLRIVASRSGGLPETDCGGMIKIKPDDPLSLAKGIAQALKKGALSEDERKRASNRYTVEKSVDSLLKIINYKLSRPEARLPRRATTRAQKVKLYRPLKLNSER